MVKVFSMDASKMTKLLLVFEDKEFNKLRNSKEKAKILGECDNWEDFILKLAGVRKK